MINGWLRGVKNGIKMVSGAAAEPPPQDFTFEHTIVDPNVRGICITKPVTLVGLYSEMKEAYKDSDLIMWPFCMEAITPQYMSMTNDWVIIAGADNIRDGCLIEGDIKYVTTKGVGYGPEPKHGEFRSIIQRNDLPEVEHVDPMGQVVALDRTTERLRWVNRGMDICAYEYDTKKLGFDHIYEQATGPIIYPVDFKLDLNYQ